MKRIVFITALNLFAGLSAWSQNLVPNSSFETISGTLNGQDQLILAQPWLPCNAFPDVFQRGMLAAPPTICNDMGIPFNGGGQADERNGQNAYAGIELDFSTNYRDYIQVPLSTPLLAGDIYRLEFQVLLADSSRYACNRLGMLLSAGVVVQPGTGVIAFTPQLESASLLNNRSNWTTITGVYQASGGENYVTIGVFRADADVNLITQDAGSKNSGCRSYDSAAYYYIDDVVVSPVNEIVQIAGDSIICPGQSAVLFANANVPFYWSLLATPNDTLSLSQTLTVSPLAPTAYILHGIFESDTVWVTIVSPPALSLGADRPICESDSIELNAYASDIVSYQWSTGSTDSSIYVYEPGVYAVQVDNSGCSSIDSIEITSRLDNPPIFLGEDSVYCFFFEDSLKLDGGDAQSWFWTPTQEQSRQITVLFPAYYEVEAVRANGCIRRAGIEVNEFCPPVTFIPNSFTPNGDLLNDYFAPKVYNTVSYSLSIMNRWGQPVFSTTDPDEGWDGTYEGTDAPSGVYVYRINLEGRDEEGIKKKEKRMGSITLIR